MTQWKYFPDTTPPRGSFHRLPIFWDGRLNAFGHKDVTARYALWENEE